MSADVIANMPSPKEESHDVSMELKLPADLTSFSFSLAARIGSRNCSLVLPFVGASSGKHSSISVRSLKNVASSSISRVYNEISDWVVKVKALFSKSSEIINHL